MASNYATESGADIVVLDHHPFQKACANYLTLELTRTCAPCQMHQAPTTSSASKYFTTTRFHHLLASFWWRSGSGCVLLPRKKTDRKALEALAGRGTGSEFMPCGPSVPDLLPECQAFQQPLH